MLLTAFPMLLVPLFADEEPARVTAETEEELYAVLEKAARRMESSITVQLDPRIRFHNLNHKICRSIVMTATTGVSCTRVSGRRAVQVHMSYDDAARMLAAYRYPELRSSLSEREQAALDEAAKRVRKLVRHGMNRYEIVEALHDDLLNRVTYTRNYYDATTMLLENKGVCAAYTRSMYLLLNMAEVPCRGVCGRVVRRGPHAWNLVQMEDGGWYHLDATWNDRGNGERPQGREYFCITDKELEAKSLRHWNKKYVQPTPLLGGYRYRLIGRYYTDYDSFWKAAEAAYDRKEESFEAYLACYTSKETFEKIYKLYRESGGRIGWYYMCRSPKRHKVGEVAIRLIPYGRKPEAEPELTDKDFPVEEDAPWLSDYELEDLRELIDADELKAKGKTFFQEGIESTEKNMKEWMRKAKDSLDTMKEKW